MGGPAVFRSGRPPTVVERRFNALSQTAITPFCDGPAVGDASGVKEGVGDPSP